MSQLLLEAPKDSAAQIEAYFKGARAAIRLYAVWREGSQYVGMGRPLKDALNDLSQLEQSAMQAWRDRHDMGEIKPA